MNDKLITLPQDDVDGPWPAQAAIPTRHREGDADLESPVATDEDPTDTAATDAQRWGPPPAHVRDAWRQLWQERGRKPTRGEMKVRIGGGNSPRNYWCKLLEREDLRPPTDPEVVAARRADLAAATQAVERWIATCREAEADIERCLQVWRDLERTRLVSDTVPLEQLDAAKQAHREAEIRATQVLPPLGGPLQEAETAAALALDQAIREAQYQGYNALGAQRVAGVTGPLETTKQAFLEELYAELARIDAQHDLALALGLHPGNPKAALAQWLYTTFAAVLPLPRRAGSLAPVEDLVAADPTMQPLGVEALAEAQRTGTVFVQYQGQARPHLQDRGLERLRLNRLNERALQEGKAIEVTHAEEAVLRDRYGDAIQRVIPPTWR